MKVYTQNYVTAIYVFFIFGRTCSAYNNDIFDHLAPSSLFTRVVEVCMRMISDTQKNYDASTQIDLCVGRLTRLNTATTLLASSTYNHKQLLNQDILYLLSLTNVAQNHQHQAIEKSTHAQALMKSVKDSLATCLTCCAH